MNHGQSNSSIGDNKDGDHSQTYGRTDISVKTEFKPRVTLGGILSEQNLELLMGQFYTSTTLMYSRGNFKPV